MSTWGVGIVGYGWVAGAHIAALRQIPRRTGGSDLLVARALDGTDIARRHEGPIDVVASLDESLARPDVDVVDICSRSNLHASQAIEAARHGKHVIVEKPIALSLAELRAMQAAVATAGVRTCVCFELRYSPQLTATRSLIDEGLLGSLHYAELDYYHHVGPELSQYEWNRLRVGGGSSLLSIGCHSVDGMLFLMGDRVTEVVTYTTQSVHPDFARYEYPTTSVTLMRSADGAVGKVASLLDAHQPYYYRVYVVGADGVVLDGNFWSTRIRGLHPDRWTELGVKLESSADVVEHPYLAQFEAFFAALDADREMPLTSLADAVPTFEVIFAADRSAELHRPVLLTELGTD